MDERLAIKENSIQPKPCYVAWIDVMGTTSISQNSLVTAANFVLKFHHYAEICRRDDDIKIFRLIDGIYVVVEEGNKQRLLEYMSKLFWKIYGTQKSENDSNKIFLIRASIAFGKIVLGEDFKNHCPSFALTGKDLLMGKPLADAYSSEHKAPPLGVFIHETARSASVTGTGNDFPLSFPWYNWWTKNTLDGNKEIGLWLRDYFKKRKEKFLFYDLEEKKIDGYLRAIDQYFDLVGV